MTFIAGSVNNPAPAEAAHNGLIRNTGTSDVVATAKSDDINQFLGSHNDQILYYGDPVNGNVQVSGGTNFNWVTVKGTLDYAQPITFTSGSNLTSSNPWDYLGRVTIPLLAQGSGANVRVTLCQDQGGGSNPNLLKPIASTLIPANWLTTLGAPFGLAQGGPMAHPAFNTMYLSGGTTTTNWTGPSAVAGSNSSGFSASTYSGNTFIMAGGQDSGGNPLPLVATATWTGGTSMGGAMAQPSLPVASYNGSLAASTPTSTLVYMGGRNNSTALSAVYTASWNSLTGAVGSWSSQASLPSVMSNSCSAVNPVTGTVYIAGGLDTSGNVNSNVYYANPSNGQISSWNVGPSLPAIRWGGYLACIGNFLIYAGGSNFVTGGVGGAGQQTVWYATLDTAGNITGTWQTTIPDLPVGVFSPSSGQNGFVVTDSAIMILAGLTSSGGAGLTSLCQVLTVANGDIAPNWELFRWTESIDSPWAAFQTGNSGQWQIFRMAPNSGQIKSATAVPVPKVSVPLPDFISGMVNGTTYHVVIQVAPGIDSSSYVQVGFANGLQNLPNAIQQNRHQSNDVGGSWTNVSISGMNTPVGIPIGFYSQGGTTYTTNGYYQRILHTVEDFTGTPGSSYNRYQSLQYSANRVTTHTKNYKQLATGVAEATLTQNLTSFLNRDPTFLDGSAYWNAGVGTFAIASSPSPASGVSSLSGLLTSTGATTTYFISEYEPTLNSGWSVLTGNAVAAQGAFFYLVMCKIYSSIAGNSGSNIGFGFNVNWYDNQVNYITTSNYTYYNYSANTWTDIVANYRPPIGARFYRLTPTVANYPNGANVYVNSPSIMVAPECINIFAPVTQLTYNAGSGGGSYPSGLVQIA